jgi:hypothetical protein
MPVETFEPTLELTPGPGLESAPLGIDLPRRMLGVHDLARIFGVRPYTIREWARRGLLPRGKRYGKFLKWHPCELGPYLEP